MNMYIPVIQEFIIRKEQVLNLEVRLFIMIFIIETLFILFYMLFHEKIKSNKVFPLIALSSFLVLFFEMIAINGKMGLISVYLKQLEIYLNSLGYTGLYWESKALKEIIFVPGNAFTLPAGLTILIMLLQILYVFYFTISNYTNRKSIKIFLSLFLWILIIILIIKGLTVDFYEKKQNIF